MKPIVYIITRCRNLDNIRFSHLVFDTIRVGYPTFDIKCIYCGDYEEAEELIIAQCLQHNVELIDSELFKGVPYENIVESLFNTATRDFILCDSDMIFHSNMESFRPTQYLAGALIPTHHNEFVGGLMQEHLHTSLLYFSFVRELQEVLKTKYKQRLNGIYTPLNYFKPFVAFVNQEVMFYDTCTNMYQAIGGQCFDASIMCKYTHLFAGSYREELKELESFKPILEQHKQYESI